MKKYKFDNSINVKVGLAMSVLSSALLVPHSTLEAENLFSESTYESMVTDNRAYSIGDVVTIYIVEVSEARSSTDSDRNGGLGISGGFAKTGRAESGSIEANLRKESGESTARAGKLKAQMTAEVGEIDENGKLFVSGRQEISVNGEEQIITISGWLRANDISPDNTVLSSRLSEAKIIYDGYEVNDEGKKRNIFYRFFSSIGLL